jgi:hypothetical protein
MENKKEEKDILDMLENVTYTKEQVKKMKEKNAKLPIEELGAGLTFVKTKEKPEVKAKPKPPKKDAIGDLIKELGYDIEEPVKKYMGGSLKSYRGYGKARQGS